MENTGKEKKKSKSPKLNLNAVAFNVDNVKHMFIIYHNMPHTSGLSLSDALVNWVHRTDEYTAESLVEYIMSKNTGYTAMTEEQYLKVKEDVS